MFAARRLTPLVSRLSPRGTRKISISSYDYDDAVIVLLPSLFTIGAVSGFAVGVFNISPFSFFSSLQLPSHEDRRTSSEVFVDSFLYTTIYAIAGGIVAILHPVVISSAIAVGVHSLVTKDGIKTSKNGTNTTSNN